MASSSNSSPRPSEAEVQTAGMLDVDFILQGCALVSISRTLLAPLDRVKFVMQNQVELNRMGLLRGQFTSSLHCFRHLVKFEGLTSLWRGNFVQVMSVLPIALAHAFIGMPIEHFVFNNFPSGHSAGGYTVAYFTARLCGAVGTAFISYPLEFCRFRLATDLRPSYGAPYHFRHSLSFFSHPMLVESPHLFYKGLGLYILGSFVFSTILSFLAGVVEPMLPSDAEEGSGAVVQSTIGFGVAAVATMTMYPVDLVRRRMMIAALSEKFQYASVAACVATVMREEGPRGFFRGAAPNLCRVFCVSALALYGLPY